MIEHGNEKFFRNSLWRVLCDKLIINKIEFIYLISIVGVKVQYQIYLKNNG